MVLIVQHGSVALLLTVLLTCVLAPADMGAWDHSDASTFRNVQQFSRASYSGSPFLLQSLLAVYPALDRHSIYTVSDRSFYTSHQLAGQLSFSLSVGTF